MRRLTGTLLVVVLVGAAPGAAHAAEAWLQPETLSRTGTYNDSADLATNSPGVAVLAWNEFANGRTPRTTVRASVRQPDGAWSPSTQLSAGAADAFQPAVGVDPQGRITAVWSAGNKILWAGRAPGQPWTAGQEIPNAAGGKPDLFVASDGTATAVWQDGYIDTSVIKTARRTLGGSWSTIETISPTWSYRSHIEGDTAGDVTVSYTHDVGTSSRSFYAVDRPNSGPWGTATPIAGGLIADNVSDLVVAPSSGAATVFWQNGDLSAPLAARTRSGAATWATAPAAVPISGGTAGRLDLGELDRAAVDGTGLVTAVWLAGKKVLTAYRAESTGTWAAPATPVAIDPGDGTTFLGPLTVASNAFGRALAAWTATGSANRYALRGPGAGTAWSTPKTIDGVPADAAPLDLAIDDTGRVAYVWGLSTGNNVQSLAVSTYGNPLSSPQPPAQPGPAPSPAKTTPPPSTGSTKAALKVGIQGTATTSRGVTFVVKASGAGTATIAIDRSGLARRASAAARPRFRRVAVVRAKLKKGRNLIRVKRVKKRKLARGSYRATITARVGGRRLKPLRITFRIRR